MTLPNSSRRHFLGSALAMAGVSSVPFALNLAAMSSAAAAGASDYKALVCLFMAGGNDHNNTVLATDSSSWSNYVSVRGSLALPAVGAANGVLPITPTTLQSGRSFALHPRMGAVKSLFDARRVAILANVGPLVQPTTLAQYKAGAVPLPPKLNSHNDQQSAWQACKPEGAVNGWGGRMGDLLASANSNINFTSISTAGNAVFLSGKTIRQYQTGASGPAPLSVTNTALFGLPAGAIPLRDIVTAERSDLLEREHVTVMKRAIDLQAALSAVIPAAGAGGVPDPSLYINPNTGVAAVNPLAQQLQTVARVIAGRNALGIKRQVFYVNIGSFDTHDDQMKLQADLLARVAHAMSYFDTVLASLQGIDLRNQVTTFTASDFGRTFTSNGDGTDHGWGAHHFIMGGAVKGGDIYGAMPVSGLGHAQDVGSGALLPQFSVEQYGATLGTWFGLSATQLLDVFPNLANFTTRNLGFMSAV